MKNILWLLLLFNTAIASYLPNAVTNLKLDTAYTAQVTTTTGSVSGENRDFIASCTAANPSVCTFNTGIFTSAPNCIASNTDSSGSVATPNIYSVSATGFTLRSIDSRNGADLATIKFGVACGKAGDYSSTSVDVYTQSMINQGWQQYTPTFSSAFGSVTNVDMWYKVRDDDLLIRGKFNLGPTTTAGVVASITLPGSYIIDTIKIANNNITTGVGRYCGLFIPHASASLAMCTTATATANNLIYVGGTHTSTTKLIPITTFPTTYPNAGAVWNVDVSVPVANRPSASYIVGSFKDYSSVPGLAANVRTDHIVVSYGTGNLSTVCSGSPCSTIAQNGAGALRIERAAAGVYNIVFARAYLTAHCTVSAASASINLMGSATPMVTAGSALSFYTSNASAYVDSFGTISCDVTY